MRTLAILICALLSLNSCTQDKKKTTKRTTGSIITKAFMVETAGETNSMGKLKFMETEEYQDGVLMSKSYFDGNQEVQGIEKYVFDTDKKKPIAAKYYAKDGSIQSTYRYDYHEGKRAISKAYAGETDELLRIEVYTYDEKGNRDSKTILNDLQVKQKTFAFGYDDKGNETKMVLADASGKPILIENYEITERDEQGRWTKKYGYMNGSKLPSTYYECTRTVSK